MELKVVSSDITKIEVDGLIVNFFEGVSQPGGATAAVNRALDGAITQLIEAGEIKGKLGELTLIHTLGKIPARRVVVAGLGKQAQFTLDKVRRIVAEACRLLRTKRAKRVATVAHGTGAGGIETSASAQAIAEGAVLGLYTFRKHITKESENGEIEELLIIERDENKLPQLERGCKIGKVVAEAANFARDMINEPANFMTPTEMAGVATGVASQYNLKCTVLEREQIQQLGMGALLGVAQGSHQTPKFIVLEYSGDSSSGGTLGLVGKGITFDSGGISIKPSEGMADMKGDMAGGAAVIATLRALAELKPRINVTGLIPATENLPGGAALKPGDILKAMNGKTIEIVTTDAEGRLILADALSYARERGLSLLVDVATLTGACRIALGTICTGAFTNNQELLNKVMKAAEAAGECVWQMPMFQEYKEGNKSDVADVKNSGGRYGGAITAAQFLSEFVEDTPWVHLDIAGTSMSDKDKGYLVKGATGVGVRTLVNLALALGEE
ncbi:MAG: leucyl aminopeptidase [Chloroflexi bacterium]|nr:leucyl aminopeptidase [Chloroflexota bacterium]